MKHATFRFYEELNDHLPADRRKVDFVHAFSGSPAVKDVIEALGVPHTEVELILVDGKSVDFSHPLEDGARVAVYPVFEGLDVTPLLRVRPRALRETRFVLDGHLGRLAAFLRMLGFDTVWLGNLDDAELARISSEQHRVLLTRDRGLLKRSVVTHGYWIRSTQPKAQLVEVLRRFDLFAALSPFTRCLRCNTPLQLVSKESVADRLPPRVRESKDLFKSCPGCGGLYWEGTHHQRMQRFIEEILEAERKGEGKPRDENGSPNGEP